MLNNLTIVCVLRTQDFVSLDKKQSNYTAEDVLRLKKSIELHLNVDYNFVCLTNLENIPGVKTIPLVGNTPGWWSKIELFRPGLFTGPTLYFDLDTIIINDITELLEKMYNEKFLMMSSRDHEDESTSCILFWNGDYSFLWENYCRTPEAIRSLYKKKPRYGDQAYLQDNVEHKRITDIPGILQNWFFYIKPNVDPTLNSKILIFQGRKNKPWAVEYNDNEIISNWKKLV